MKTILAAISLLLLVTASSLGQAPDFNYATPCEAYADADAVFVGKVIKIVPETIAIWQRDKDYDQMATVVIEKTYKGRKRNRLVFHQLGRKNAPKFVLGSRYLFYANFDRVTKMWEVKPGGSTRMVEYANDDLHYLDGLPASLKKTRIAGEVVRYETSADNPQGTSERLVGIKLKIFGNGKEYEAVTDADGVYEIYGAPSGSYTIRPEIPSGLTLLAVMHYGRFDRSKVRSLTIELKEGGCSGASILLTPHLLNGNQIDVVQGYPERPIDLRQGRNHPGWVPNYPRAQMLHSAFVDEAAGYHPSYTDVAALSAPFKGLHKRGLVSRAFCGG